MRKSLHIGQPDLTEIYASFLKRKNKNNVEKRYSGKNKKYYHASGGGLCVRKHWFEVSDIEPADTRDEKSNRLLRLGSIVHNDFEDAFIEFQKEKERTKEKETIENGIFNSNLLSTIRTIRTEGEVVLSEINVRGFYDVVVEMESGEVYLYDLKTIGSYPYKKKFGRYAAGSPNQSIHHEMQIATYGIAVTRDIGRLNGMFLLYYNKDNSVCKEVTVPLSMMDRAYEYWKNAHKEISTCEKPPPLQKDVSPSYPWECNYCSYYTTCMETSNIGDWA